VRRGESEGVSSRPSERAARSSAPYPRREKVDPWFLKPYEPAAAPRRDSAPAASSPAKPGKQKIAALLGGLPKQ
jgi:ATP-dependent RNA helicase RhlE